MAPTSIGLEPRRFQKAGRWQYQDLESCKRTDDLPFEIVYTRQMEPNANRASSITVRSVLNITDTLESAFRIAISRTHEINQRSSAGENPHTLQIWHYGQLLALARLSRPDATENKSASPFRTEPSELSRLHTHWIRTPTVGQILKWTVDLDMAISFSGHSNGIEEVGAGENARAILMDLLLTEFYAAPTDQIFKVLYKVEREMGSSQAISVHLENDLGM